MGVRVSLPGNRRKRKDRVTGGFCGVPPPVRVWTGGRPSSALIQMFMQAAVSRFYSPVRGAAGQRAKTSV